jgi:hypothetical protein
MLFQTSFAFYGVQGVHVVSSGIINGTPTPVALEVNMSKIVVEPTGVGVPFIIPPLTT